MKKTGLTPTSQFVLGFALNETFGWYARICTFYNGVDPQFAVYVDSSGYISFFEDPFAYTTPDPVEPEDPENGRLAISTRSLGVNTWYYFEIVNNGTTLSVLVDGESWVSVNYTVGGTDGFLVAMPHIGYIDDLYFENTSTPLDAPRIITLYPNEAGAETGWKDTWREVESTGGYRESIDNEYISSFTSLQKESWKYNELPPGDWDIHAVGPVFRTKNNGAGSPTLKISCSTGASTGSIDPSNTFTHTKHVENFSDAGGTTAWTEAAVNGLEITVEYE